MLNRPEYKKLVATMKRNIENQKPSGLVAITRGLIECQLGYRFYKHDMDQSWPKAVKECGLMDDGTRTDTFTVPGYGFTVFQRVK